MTLKTTISVRVAAQAVNDSETALEWQSSGDDFLETVRVRTAVSMLPWWNGEVI